MRICRFTVSATSTAQFGIIDGDQIRGAQAGTIESVSQARLDQPIKAYAVKLLAPVTPSKIVCVGRNYREHAAELGNTMPTEPLLFLKAPSAIIASGDAIQLPPESAQVEHEGELGVVIAKQAHRLAPDDDPLRYVLGYTCVNDVTARDLQRKDVQ